MDRPWREVTGMRLRYVVLLAIFCVVGLGVAMLQFPNDPIWAACVMGVCLAVEWWLYVFGALRAWDESRWLTYDFPHRRKSEKQTAEDKNQADQLPPLRKR